MKSHLHNNTSIAEREQRVWIASKKYMRGEISADELEEIERYNSLNLKEACIALAKQNQTRLLLRNITIGMIAFVTVLLIISSITFFNIRNPLTTFFLLLPLAFIPFLVQPVERGLASIRDKRR